MRARALKELVAAPIPFSVSNSSERTNWPLQLGLVLTVASPLLCIVFLALGALTINPCGAFGDACDEAGQSTGEGRALFALAVLMVFSFVGGVVALVIGLDRRRATSHHH
jgi:hypothetical protein